MNGEQSEASSMSTATATESMALAMRRPRRGVVVLGAFGGCWFWRSCSPSAGER